MGSSDSYDGVSLLRGGQRKRTFRWFNSIVTHTQGSSLPLVVIADPDTLEVEWYEGEAVGRLIEPMRR